MIVDERMRTYINSLDMGNTPFLEELEQYAIRERVPIIRREMQSFIKMFLAVNRPKRIFVEWGQPLASPHFLCVNMVLRILKS